MAGVSSQSFIWSPAIAIEWRWLRPASREATHKLALRSSHRRRHKTISRNENELNCLGRLHPSLPGVASGLETGSASTLIDVRNVRLLTI